MLKSAAEKYLSTKQLQGVKDGEYSIWASAGKKLLSKFTEPQKIDIINSKNTAIAHNGELMVDKCWTFSKIDDVKLLKKDGSNFF